MRKRTVSMLIAALAVLTIAVPLSSAAAGSAEARPSDASKQRTAEQTRALVAALERKDLDVITAMTDEQAMLTLPLSFSGDQAPQARFVGKDQVLGYINGVFTNMATVRFVDVRVSVTADGRTSFVQANGDFTTADGRPYRNVYVFRYDWSDGHLTNVEEYGNPVTFCKTFGAPDC